MRDREAIERARARLDGEGSVGALRFGAARGEVAAAAAMQRARDSVRDDEAGARHHARG